MDNKESSIKRLYIVTAVLFIAVVIFGIVDIKQMYTICKAKEAVIAANELSHVDEKIAVKETASTSYGVNYSKEGEMSLDDVDEDVEEAFEILDCVRMRIEIKFRGNVYYRAYTKGSDGFTYLVETDESGNILRDDDGNAYVIKRCEFGDLYFGEQ